MSQREISWKFSPPAAPHFGGSWERLIKSAKAALKIVLNGYSTTDEVLSTAMTEVEAMLNARPLTHVSVDATEPDALTPNHFLLGRPSVEGGHNDLPRSGAGGAEQSRAFRGNQHSGESGSAGQKTTRHQPPPPRQRLSHYRYPYMQRLQMELIW